MSLLVLSVNMSVRQMGRAAAALVRTTQRGPEAPRHATSDSTNWDSVEASMTSVEARRAPLVS